MGCDIHLFIEIRKNGKWVGADNDDILCDRSYARFAFFADVRNNVDVDPISKPRGLPKDTNCFIKYDYHSHSWLSLRELIEFNYDQPFSKSQDSVDREINYWARGKTKILNDGSYRALLDEHYFKDLEKLKTYGDLDDVRIVFYFDS
jgi:hypothetical protein